MKHLTVLSAIKDMLNPLYKHTRCPVCFYVVNLDRHGLMESHGSGELPCVGSGRNDIEIATELDAALEEQTKRDAVDETNLRAEA